MQIIGRITADAKVATLKDSKQVVNFTVAVNDGYKNKSGEWVALTEYFRCAYWRSAKVAPALTKGRLVEITGRPNATAWIGQDGEAKANLNFRAAEIRFHDAARKGTTESPLQNTKENSGDDLPF